MLNSVEHEKSFITSGPGGWGVKNQSNQSLEKLKFRPWASTEVIYVQIPLPVLPAEPVSYHTCKSSILFYAKVAFDKRPQYQLDCSKQNYNLP